MIDMHIHILPGFDDGAWDMEEAVEMAWSAVDSSVNAVVATSHIGPSFQQKELLERKKQYTEKLELFRRELNRRKIPLSVYSGMEVLAGEGFIEALLQGNLLTLNHSRFVLAEFWFDEKEGMISETIYRLKKAGYGMVMAHPERYDCVKRKPKILADWKREGVLCQLNAGSFFGDFGATVRRTAEWILYHGLADLVASDAHDTVNRRAGFDEIRYLLEELCGIEQTDRLLFERARKLLLLSHNRK